MATEVIKDVILIYRLTLDKPISASSTDLPKLVLEQGVRKEFKDDKREYYLTFRGLKVNRKIYQPVEIQAEIDFMQKAQDSGGGSVNASPSFKDISALFLQRQVKLEILQVDRLPDTTRTLEYQNRFTVAENCYVYELHPQLKQVVNGTKMYVKLDIFSMDKLMTLNKYSKAYVARKLGSGILQPESLQFGLFSEDTPLVQSDVSGQRFLMYGDKEDEKYEFIQPYLVQYNESFYDFLKRTSNRCGEFLYFEDGKLILGLPKSDPAKINTFETVTAQNISADPLTVSSYARDSVKEGDGELKPYSKDEIEAFKKAGKDIKENRGEKTILNQTVVNKQTDGFPLEAFPANTVSNLEVATDEYIFPLFKDHFSNIPREMFYYGEDSDVAMFQALKAGKTFFNNTIDAVGGLLASIASASSPFSSFWVAQGR